MYCKHCGSIIDDNSTYCPSCGTNQNSEESVSSTRKKIKIKKAPIIIVLSLLILVSILLGRILHVQNSYTAPLFSDDLFFLYDDSDPLEIRNTIIPKFSAKDVAIEITYSGNKGLFDSYSETHELGDLEPDEEITIVKSISSLEKNLRGEFEHASLRVVSGYKQKKNRGVKKENNTECSFEFTYNPHTNQLIMTVKNNTHKSITELRNFRTTISFSDGGELNFYTPRIILPETLSPGASVTLTSTGNTSSSIKSITSSKDYTQINYQVVYK